MYLTPPIKGFPLDADSHHNYIASLNNPTPAPAPGSIPLELGICAWLGVKTTRMMWLPGRERSLTISHLDTVHERDGQTDTGRQQRPRLRIASRGKNGIQCLQIANTHTDTDLLACWSVRGYNGTDATGAHAQLTRGAKAHEP